MRLVVTPEAFMEYTTLNQLFFASMENYRRPDALSYKSEGAWRRLSWQEMLARVGELALGFHELGIRRGDRVTLLSENRPEWFLIDKALLALGAVGVPVYPTLTPPQVVYIIQNSESTAVIGSTPAQQAKLTEVQKGVSGVQHWLRMDPPGASGFSGQGLEEIVAWGRTRAEREPELWRRLASEVKPEDLASIIYTSGTTGEPKGVMLTHDNFVSNVKAASQRLPVGTDDVALSVLPFCHVFERMVANYLYLARGVAVVLAESLDALPQNLLEVRPTVMTCVPRFYEKLYGRVLDTVSSASPLRRRIFWWAVGVGLAHSRFRMEGKPAPFLLELKNKLATLLAFKKLQARVGGRLRFFVSGGAPLARTIAEFFWAAGIPILEGYGLTETSPVLTVNTPEEVKLGTVGRAIPGVELSIAEDGEILARGSNIMKGYYRNEAATREVIDPDGWFHTGDIGLIDAEGFLAITDRKKDLIVTAGGKKLAPQPIENRLKTNPYLAEVVLVGNRRRFPSALVVPNFEKLAAWAAAQGILADDKQELARHPRAVDFIQKQIDEMTADLAQFEKIKKVTLLAREFTLEGGEITPTLKVKRNVIENRYAEVIEQMYRD
jgi:long-chain acyl-CoA synthetase